MHDSTSTSPFAAVGSATVLTGPLAGAAVEPTQTAVWVRRGRKRAFDVIVGGALCLVALPVIVALAAILAVQLRAWPFFVHERTGHRGRVIRFPKLRTLPVTTPAYADKRVVALAPVSQLASFLRARHLDELPQLFLVPLGRMTLVGPRPKMPSEVADAGWEWSRELVRQGCTGLWQVGAHTDDAVSSRPEYDLAYLVGGSVRMDLWILWRTAAQALSGRGVALDEVPAAVWGSGFVAGDERAAVRAVARTLPDPAPALGQEPVRAPSTRAMPLEQVDIEGAAALG
ncbi:MAG: sugar transferase [Actinobacteria bacterium]|nr:sugar transferase [Actinomycetota bacterium]